MLCAALIACSSSTCEAQLEAPPALRVSGEIIGGVLGLIAGAGLGVGFTALGIELFEQTEPESEEARGRHFFGAVVFILASIPITAFLGVMGVTAGTYGAGELLGGDANPGAVALGAGIGAAIQAVTLIALLAGTELDVDGDEIVPVLIGTSALPLLGAVLGYALSDAEMSPIVGGSTDGAFAGMRAMF
jgi:hypothetical protein